MAAFPLAHERHLDSPVALHAAAWLDLVQVHLSAVVLSQRRREAWGALWPKVPTRRGLHLRGQEMRQMLSRAAGAGLYRHAGQ